MARKTKPLKVPTASLSQVLEWPECLDLLRAYVKNPVKKSGATLVLPPPKGRALDYGAIGTAYDYWLRCQLQPLDEKLYESFVGFQWCRSRYLDKGVVQKILTKHIAILAKPRRQSNVDRELLAACLFLAKFETEYRSRYPITSFEVNESNVEELGRVAKASDLSIFSGRQLTLNPSFSVQGSRLGIKADGDLLADKTLFDFKTSAKMNLIENLRQLVCYAVLNALGMYNRPIEALAVYYPRFAYATELTLSDVISRDDYFSLREWFAAQLGKPLSQPAPRVAPAVGE